MALAGGDTTAGTESHRERAPASSSRSSRANTWTCRATMSPARSINSVHCCAVLAARSCTEGSASGWPKPTRLRRSAGERSLPAPSHVSSRTAVRRSLPRGSTSSFVSRAWPMSELRTLRAVVERRERALARDPRRRCNAGRPAPSLDEALSVVARFVACRDGVQLHGAIATPHAGKRTCARRQCPRRRCVDQGQRGGKVSSRVAFRQVGPHSGPLGWRRE